MHEFRDLHFSHCRFAEHAFILERRPDEVYVHYAHADKRLDEWVAESDVRLDPSSPSSPEASVPDAPAEESDDRTDPAHMNKKRKRSVSVEAIEAGESASTGGMVKMSEEEYDIEHHKQITAKRNFDKVIFGRWQIKTWCVY